MSYKIIGQVKKQGRTKTGPLTIGVFTNTLAFTLNNPTPAVNDNFGRGVSVDGNRAIVGSPRDNGTGSAYIYDVTTGNLLYTINNPTPQAEDLFGFSVSISGNRAIVGAWLDNTGATSSGSAYIYDVTTGNLLFTINNPAPEASDYFGIDVAISGNRAIVGARNDNTGATQAGSAYIYDVTTGNLLHTLNNPTPQADDWFGRYVAISGNRAIVGAYNDDTGAVNAGSAYIYDVTTGNLLHTLNNPTPQADDWFGVRVAISGNRAIVGAQRDNTGATDTGSAYIYDVTTGNLLHTINNPAPEANDLFGASVAISGNRAMVGAYNDDTGAVNAGSAYIYDVTTGNLLHTINNPAPEANDLFGVPVDISGTTVIIGALLNNAGATDAGSAYIYK